jgi:uncharacterized protein YbaA (DUF1428 family)
MAYVDGFVIPILKKNLAAYRKLASQAGKVWMAHGALQYYECAGDDLNTKGMLAFPKIARAKAGETVLFSYIVYKSKAHRNSVNKKVMNDPRLKAMMDQKMPFDVKRMAYGGFKSIVKF